MEKKKIRNQPDWNNTLGRTRIRFKRVGKLFSFTIGYPVGRKKGSSSSSASSARIEDVAQELYISGIIGPHWKHPESEWLDIGRNNGYSYYSSHFYLVYSMLYFYSSIMIIIIITVDLICLTWMKTAAKKK